MHRPREKRWIKREVPERETPIELHMTPTKVIAFFVIGLNCKSSGAKKYHVPRDP